jgi:membrane protease YdiL (CAAX protease family)
MIFVQHALALFLVIGMPLWDWYEIPRLKASTAPGKKVRYYRKIVTALWICAAIAVWTMTIADVFSIHKMPGEIAWLDKGSAGAVALMGIAAGIFIAISLPAILALRNEKIRSKAAKAAKRLAFLLPSSGEERRWWWLVCLTAGICEEIIYRGFLLRYWHVLPWHLTLTWALVVSSVIFGIGHIYQGAAGAVQTTVIGFIFGGLFMVTGTLWLPIVAHALLDLRILAMLPEGFDSPEASPTAEQ